MPISFAADLKNAVSDYLGACFTKAREYFEKHKDLIEALGPEFLA